ncbi:hypothetical protein E2562_034916 [Oryza meyeriana var. granulata]|uniref:Uncharacterized protein n=1 Tax=Oryza meyeriana var. granulata TaxID=110450 RepID=A0A6G1F1G7_9ORYZ|nr:hypothetical protein E2562_034916 [Oryza meyeriana var. granulata]
MGTLLRPRPAAALVSHLPVGTTASSSSAHGTAVVCSLASEAAATVLISSYLVGGGRWLWRGVPTASGGVDRVLPPGSAGCGGGVAAEGYGGEIGRRCHGGFAAGAVRPGSVFKGQRGSVKVIIHHPFEGNDAENLCSEARKVVIADNLLLNGYAMH